MKLKKQLKELINNTRIDLTNQKIDTLIKDMLQHIGTIDSELRDNLIYPTFVRLISEDHLDKQHLNYIMDSCLDNNHLFYQIGETKSDSVFRRSFSSLVIAAILIKDKDVRLLSDKILINVFEKVHSYLRLEKDTRGYVDGKGWAHSIAHGADLLVSAIRHPDYNMDHFNDCLDTVQNCIFKGRVYTDDEDERLIFVIDSLIDKGLQETELDRWILRIFNNLETIFKTEGHSLSFYQIKTNVLNFVKTLYFRLGSKNAGNKARIHIVENLESWHNKLY